MFSESEGPKKLEACLKNYLQNISHTLCLEPFEMLLVMAMVVVGDCGGETGFYCSALALGEKQSN